MIISLNYIDSRHGTAKTHCVQERAVMELNFAVVVVLWIDVVGNSDINPINQQLVNDM
jgi:hypothetical protein